MGSDTYVFEHLNLSDFTIRETTAIVPGWQWKRQHCWKLLSEVLYEPQEGELRIGNTPLKNVSPRFGGDHCGVVMQEELCIQ